MPAGEPRREGTDAVTSCTWSTEFDPDDPSAKLEYCATGKPALFYSCNESGPVCEEHVCRCRPSLLSERTMKRESAPPPRLFAVMRFMSDGIGVRSVHTSLHVAQIARGLEDGSVRGLEGYEECKHEVLIYHLGEDKR